MAISASVASRVNVAFHQNSVPAVGEIELSAAPGVSFGEIRLRVTATPPFLKSKEFVFDSISEGGTLRLEVVELDLDLVYLTGLKEAVRGELVLEAFAGDRSIAQLHW
ncbi:MAG: hypothetical protein LCH61_17790 [Proteobacteria bacterium]|nr:hypothetical protein [Pseudomonadota bacterium]